MKEIDFSNVEKPEEAFKRISAFFQGFKQQRVKDPAVIREDHYRVIHNLSRLIEKDGNPTSLYVYDKRIFCPGCISNCGGASDKIEIRGMFDKDSVDKFFETSVDIPHELTRNLSVMVCCGGYDLLEIRAGKNKRESWGRVRFYLDRHVKDITTEYEQTMDAITNVRQINFVD